MAVKTLTAQEPEVVRKFLEEAELMKKFSHPNILSILGTMSLTQYKPLGCIMYNGNACATSLHANTNAFTSDANGRIYTRRRTRLH